MKRSLEGRRNSQTSWRDLPFKLLFFVVLLYTFYNLFLSQYNIFKVYELRRASLELDAQIARQRSENSKIEQILELIKENPEYFKERFARQYMQLQKEGEYIILFRH